MDMDYTISLFQETETRRGMNTNVDSGVRDQPALSDREQPSVWTSAGRDR